MSKSLSVSHLCCFAPSPPCSPRPLLSREVVAREKERFLVPGTSLCFDALAIVQRSDPWPCRLTFSFVSSSRSCFVCYDQLPSPASFERVWFARRWLLSSRSSRRLSGQRSRQRRLLVAFFPLFRYVWLSFLPLLLVWTRLNGVIGTPSSYFAVTNPYAAPLISQKPPVNCSRGFASNDLPWVIIMSGTACPAELDYRHRFLLASPLRLSTHD